MDSDDNPTLDVALPNTDLPLSLLNDLNDYLSLTAPAAPPGSPVNVRGNSDTKPPKGFSWKIIEPMELFDPQTENEETVIVTFRVPENIARELSDQKMPEFSDPVKEVQDKTKKLRVV